ncbi:HlyD family type I secretion periplasmic adaptor subunit [Devosia rhodophyticola]|uniref:Membrane fusion protein (MFP) family protein n=1 Tax=Devosia rhodophyticola TaxID=3026423 RepID=A0ABY7YYB5_9HYPH|nr:HlyD family type I secretion periplasmic adaptor subunit [Devosia rhodophyticola]WDR06217.1 HlyD family type I secretion periplasmic adaptor subunit [Devosia rhodophyticola]
MTPSRSKSVAPISARMTLYLVALAIGCGIYWASVSQLDEIVVATGKLTTSEPTLVMQPLETSIIRQMNVKAGDIVSKGQLLATLDPTFASADTGQLQAKLDGFKAQIARIEAELDNSLYQPPLGSSPEARMQGQLAAQRLAAYNSRLADFDAQIAHGQAVIDKTKSEEQTLGDRLAGLQEIQSMYSTLADSGNGSRLTFLQSRDVSLDIEVTLTQVRGQAAEAAQQIEQTRAERQNFVEEYRRVAMEELVDLMDRQSGASEELRKVDLRTAMSRLIAPADAAVLEVAQRSVASVVQPAEPLITLVPLNVPLEVEVSVAGNDIGHLTTGDAARIKFDAFPFQKHGTVEGHVTSISENSFAKQANADQAGGAAFYKVRIALGEDELRNVPATFRMLPGMTVAAEIHAGERSVISYFLYPLIRGLDESLREP